MHLTSATHDAEPPTYLDAATLEGMVDFRFLVDELGRALSQRPSASPLRSHLQAPAGDLLVMPHADEQAVGVKIVGVCRSNPARGLPLINGLYLLFDPETLTPRTLIDGAGLTALRTASVSGLATDHLARKDSHDLVIFGAGVQGRAHLHAMLAVRPIERLTIVSRSPGPAERLVAHAEGLGVSARIGDSDAVSDADIVCTCTTSHTPVLRGGNLRPGTHVNAIGAFRPTDRELDDDAIRQGLLVVDTIDGALAEAGDVVIPLRSGKLSAARLTELRDIVTGAAGRTNREDVTVFKSVGESLQDAIVATAVSRQSARRKSHWKED